MHTKRSPHTPQIRRSHTRPNVHRIWHRIHPTIASYLECSDQQSKDRLTQIMNRHLQRYPNDVFRAQCDDEYFSTSSLYFILHRDGTRFMGTSILFVSQCDDQVPATFFLYPSHVTSLQNALRLCQRAYVGSNEWKQDQRIKRRLRQHQRTPARRSPR